jgi:hypothetical protein
LPARPNSWIILALSTAAALCLAVQCLFPNFIGLANNGDFAKVYGYFSLAPHAPITNFIFFQPDYTFSAGNFWDSPYHSSETALAWVATRLARATREGAPFDIRWLGAIHAALCLSAFAILLAAWRKLPPLALAASAILPLIVFTDVCYTAYLNTFYMDAAALCALLLMTATAVWLATAPGTFPLCMFTAAALFFVTSKAQHALWMWLPAAFLLSQNVGQALPPANPRIFRTFAAAASALVLFAGIAMLVSTDLSYRGQALFNVIFFRLGPAGADLRELGITPSELHYTGSHSYAPGAPTNNRQWSEQFYARTGTARLMNWYLRHPARTLRFLGQTLRDGAAEMRPYNLSNFPQSAGRPPGARTARFALWSDWRTALVLRWPWHLLFWYLLFVAACAATRSRLKWLALGVATLGAGEFFAAALGDALDAGRHLFLFQAATDLTICFAVAFLAQTFLAQTHPATIRNNP